LAAPGGKASWTHTSIATFFWLRACDRQKDGHGVQAYASVIKGGRQNLVEDTDGANGKCKKRRIGISFTNMGRPVYVTVCLRKSGNRFCDTDKGRATF
jgi:hypothetical protein